MTNHTGGVVLERISGKKLSFIVGTLLLIQFVFFMIGAFKCIFFYFLFSQIYFYFTYFAPYSVPNATHTETVEGIMCKDKMPFKGRLKNAKEEADANEFIYLRDYIGRPISNCDPVPIDENVVYLNFLISFYIINKHFILFLF